MDINSLSIESAEMSVRSTNALHRAEIHTVGDMLKHNKETLQSIRNLGAKSIAECEFVNDVRPKSRKKSSVRKRSGATNSDRRFSPPSAA